jgi:glucose/mannose-6-phosphate isomerase
MNMLDSGRLDDLAGLTAADPGEMLRQVASAAAQVRQAQLLAAEAGVARLAGEARPRAVVVAGMGAAAVTGDLVAALCTRSGPIPVLPLRGNRLPGWVGAADLVVAVSGSGRTEETLATAIEAIRRGCRLLCVGPDGEDVPLAGIAAQGRGLYLPVHPEGRESRALLWGLTVPVVLALRTLGLLDAPDAVLEAVATRLEDVSHRCRPASESFVNPGKQLALDLGGQIPLVWGGSPLAGVAARRFAGQLAANAKYPAVYGELPAVGHDQIAAFDGPFARGGADSVEDFFRDRTDEPETRLHLVLLRDDEDPAAASISTAAADLARDRGIAVTELPAEGGHPLERVATLIALADYATVYLAIALDIDPTPVVAGRELGARRP